MSEHPVLRRFACFHRSAPGRWFANGFVHADTAGEALRRFKAICPTARTFRVVAA